MVLFHLSIALLVVALALVLFTICQPSIKSRIHKRLAHKRVRFKKILAIVNPISGNRRGEQDWLLIATALRARGAIVDTLVTDHSGHAAHLLNGANKVQEYDLLAVVGGDGFFHEVLNALDAARPKAVLAVPSGTGNGISTSLGIRSPIDAAEACVAEGDIGAGTMSDDDAITPLDVIRVVRPDATTGAGNADRVTPSSTVAALSVAWGAIADHDALTERELRRMPLKLLLVPLWIILRNATYRGRVSFTPSAGRQGPLPPGKAHTVDVATGRVHIDGEFNLVHVCNLPWIATDVHAAPGATPDGGCFGILILRGASRLELLSMFLAAESGTHTSHAAVELYWATEATIAPAAGPCGLGNIAVDGELLPPSRVELRCEPSALRAVTRCANVCESS